MNSINILVNMYDSQQNINFFMMDDLNKKRFSISTFNVEPAL